MKWFMVWDIRNFRVHWDQEKRKKLKKKNWVEITWKKKWRNYYRKSCSHSLRRPLVVVGEESANRQTLNLQWKRPQLFKYLLQWSCVAIVTNFLCLDVGHDATESCFPEEPWQKFSFSLGAGRDGTNNEWFPEKVKPINVLLHRKWQEVFVSWVLVMTSEPRNSSLQCFLDKKSALRYIYGPMFPDCFRSAWQRKHTILRWCSTREWANKFRFCIIDWYLVRSPLVHR